MQREQENDTDITKKIRNIKETQSAPKNQVELAMQDNKRDS